MKVELLALADYATRSDGKLTLVGVFDRLNATSLPTVVPAMGLAFKMRLSEPDLRAKPHVFKCEVLSPTGKSLINVGGEMVAKRPASAPADEPAEMGTAEFAFMLSGVKFSEFGKHLAKLTVDEKLLAETPLFVVEKKGV